MTKEIQVGAAAQATLLLLNRWTHYFPRLLSILVYTTPFTAPRLEHRTDGTARRIQSGDPRVPPPARLGGTRSPKTPPFAGTPPAGALAGGQPRTPLPAGSDRPVPGLGPLPGGLEGIYGEVTTAAVPPSPSTAEKT